MKGLHSVVVGICVVLLCAACVPRSEGEQGMNPEQKAAVEVAEHLHSIEEFQRDVEPAIIAARNEWACSIVCVSVFLFERIDA